MDKQSTHAAEFAEIKRIWTLIDCPSDALYALAVLQEFFRVHPEYLNLPENASFASKYKRKSVGKLLWPGSEEGDDLIREMQRQVATLRVE